MDTNRISSEGSEFYIHSQFLSALPEAITEIYYHDKAGAALRNDIACRLIAECTCE